MSFSPVRSAGVVTQTAFDFLLRVVSRGGDSCFTHGNSVPMTFVPPQQLLSHLESPSHYKRVICLCIPPFDKLICFPTPCHISKFRKFITFGVRYQDWIKVIILDDNEPRLPSSPLSSRTSVPPSPRTLILIAENTSLVSRTHALKVHLEKKIVR